MSTVSDGSTGRRPVSADQAITPAQGSVAASSYERCAGIVTSASWSATANSASMPSRVQPNCSATISTAKRPSRQRGK